MLGSRIIGERNYQSQLYCRSACSPVFWGFELCLLKKTKNQPDAQDAPRTRPEICSNHHENINFTDYYQSSAPHTAKIEVKGEQDSGGDGSLGNVGELEEEVREGSSISMSKYLTGMVQRVSWKKRFLVMFQNGCKNYLTSNQLTIVIVEKSPVGEEPKVPTIPDIPEDKVTSDKGYYHGVYVLLYFNKDGGVDSN